MNKEDVRTEHLRATNPLFNDRKLKLGTFGTNLSHGCTVSTIEGALTPDWASTSVLARMADEMQFEAIVPVGRWRGFGGETDFNGSGFDSYSFAAAMAAQVKYPSVFATSHTSTVHPVMAAKQGTTIDHVSGGRFSLNLITGWYKPEFDSFGQEMLGHDERYDAAAEWLEIVKLLWVSDRPVDYTGKYYQVRQALLKPQPIQRPCPPVMSAGQSTKGRAFAAKYADIMFIIPQNRKDVAAMRAEIENFRAAARAESGRDMRLWSYCYLIQGETEAQAQKLYHHCVHEKGDWTGVNNVLDAMGMSNQSMPSEIRQRIKEDFVAGFGGVPLIGTKEQIVDGLALMADAGLDGVLLSWPAYIEGMKQFQRETHPLLVQAGLR